MHDRDLEEAYEDVVLNIVRQCGHNFYRDTGRPATTVLVETHMYRAIQRAISYRMICATVSVDYMILDGMRIVPVRVAPGVTLPLAYAEAK